ncbi:MAG: hypothetical protein IJ179_11470 [Oscillospiraceae bacterium]|nr:hypothetical protein [Oscillospiraceae bacterium]MBQ9250971.1 hypothetical protein [Oscillospiraceae bacterium]
MNKKKLCLVLLAVILVMSSWITPALAYFTTYTRAKGGYTVQLKTTTNIDESFEDWTKSLTVTNTEGAAVYIRARAYAGSTYTLKYSGSGWTYNADDGWWYYGPAVAAGESAAVLNVKITDIPEATEVGSFNVAVVYESTPVQYNADGSSYADWDMVLDRKEAEG